MKGNCISGKRSFATHQLAEDFLIDLWARNEYDGEHAPINVYRCQDCGQYHLTSGLPMSEALATYIKSDKYRIQRQANRWIDKFKK